MSSHTCRYRLFKANSDDDDIMKTQEDLALTMRPLSPSSPTTTVVVGRYGTEQGHSPRKLTEWAFSYSRVSEISASRTIPAHTHCEKTSNKFRLYGPTQTLFSIGLPPKNFRQSRPNTFWEKLTILYI